MKTTTTTTAKRSLSRHRLLIDLPATERTIDAAGISTSVLEGGIGSPVILLHGPAARGGLDARAARARCPAPRHRRHGVMTSVGREDRRRTVARSGEHLRYA